MLRRLVRSYYRLRYFPRHVFETLTGISNAIAGLHRHEHETFERLMSTHEERLARVHEEIAAFCDDAIRAMMTVAASTADIGTRIQSLQHGLQRLDNGTIDAQGRLAALQQSLQPPPDQAGLRTADPQTIAALTELVRHQASQIDRIETLVREQAMREQAVSEPGVSEPAVSEPGVGEQARPPPAPTNATMTANGPDQMAGDDSRLSHA